MKPDTRIIKLPPRSMFAPKKQTEPTAELLAELAVTASKVDPELAEVIRSWPNLSPELKSAMLTLAAVTK